MMSVDRILEATRPKPRARAATFELAYGDVLGTSPTLVRFPGDTVDTEVTERLDSYTPVTNDRVLLARVGPTWIIIGALA